MAVVSCQSRRKALLEGSTSCKETQWVKQAAVIWMEELARFFLLQISTAIQILSINKYFTETLRTVKIVVATWVLSKEATTTISTAVVETLSNL